VVVVVLGRFGFAMLGLAAVAAEFGFVEEVGAAAGEDFEDAIFDSGADGGDALAEVVLASADREAAPMSSVISPGLEGSAYHSTFLGKCWMW
jgi:hypothetical protein